MWIDGRWITTNYGLAGGLLDATELLLDGARRLLTAFELEARGLGVPPELAVVRERGTGPGRHPWFVQGDN